MSSQAAIGGTFNIPANINVTVTVPGSAIIGTDDPIVATPVIINSAEQAGAETVSIGYCATCPTIVGDLGSPVSIVAP